MNGLGKRGEDLAAERLESLGYAILERNVRLSGGELDAVAREGGAIVFVEVKTRSGTGYGTPQEAVDLVKQKRLTGLAQEWLQMKGLEDMPARFDVVAVTMDSRGRPGIEIFRNAFEAVS